MKHPNLTSVRTFVAIAESGSFGEAAKRLGLAQSTVSLQLKKLEQEVTATLIERSHAGCTLTPRGARMLPSARAFVAAADRFVSSIDGNKITIGCSGNIASYYITEDFERFLRAEGRNINWDIKVATNPELVRLLAEGAIDLAAMEWPAREETLRVYPWRREKMVVIVPQTHKLARRRTISCAQLLDLDFIGGETGSGTGTVLRDALGKRASKLNITRNLHSTEAVKSAVKAGLGCSVVLAGAVRDEAKDGRMAVLKIRDKALEKMLYVAVKANQPASSLPVQLADFLSK